MFTKRRKKSSGQVGEITKAMRTRVWDMYIGTAKTRAVCPLCGLAEIFYHTNSAWQAAHIVARNWFVGSPHVYNFVPSCAGCNNECQDVNVFDYLLGRGRRDAIRRIGWTVFVRYKSDHPEEMGQFKGMCWKLTHHLFGADQFLTGAIQNKKAIYELLKSHQINNMAKELAELAKQIEEKSNTLHELLECEINKWEIV